MILTTFIVSELTLIYDLCILDSNSPHSATLIVGYPSTSTVTMIRFRFQNIFFTCFSSSSGNSYSHGVVYRFCIFKDIERMYDIPL